MQNTRLLGRSILVVEDQPLIALDITQELEDAGASVTATSTLKHALLLAEHDGLAGAIVDHVLLDGDSSLLCQRLKDRGIPFVIYSGYDVFYGPCKNARYISKPAEEGALVTAMEELLRGTPVLQAEMSPLLVEQRETGDRYRNVHKAIQELYKLMASKNVEVIGRASLEAEVVTHTAALTRLGQRMHELDALVAKDNVQTH